MKGTLLNTATVAAGATIGLLAGHWIPESYQDVAMHGLGLVVCGLGIKMFLKSRNSIVPAIAVAVGGIVGLALGIHSGIEHFSEWARSQAGGEAKGFSDALITTFVVFCVGPMTLLGCIKDGLEGDIELLALKSTLDGIVAVFFAITGGVAVYVTAILLFLFQGGLTLLARPLKPLVQDHLLIDEIEAAGGAILVGIGIHLIGLADLHTANYTPALVLAPLVAIGFKRLEGAKVKS